MIYPWQTQQWKQFVQQREQNRLPHALLLFGDAGIGKAQFARDMAASLLCQSPNDTGMACGHCSACKLLVAQTHPDLRILRPEPPKDSTSKKPLLLIRIKAIRELCTRMAMTSQFEQGYRIAILENADGMNIEAANALLKTLEEPGQNVLLILTSSHPYRLPVTIRSRCQGQRFPRPPREQVLSWLQANQVSQAELKLELAHGAPLLALEQLSDDNDARGLLSAALLAGMKQQGLAHASALANLPSHQGLSWMLDWISDLVRLKQLNMDAVRLVNQDHHAALKAYAGEADLRRLYGLYDLVCSYIRAESIPLNGELLWENLLLSWQGLK
jgi:DNA polymerase-3 subunit delta'